MQANRFLIAALPVAAIAVAAAPGAYAVEYLSVGAALKLMFPDATDFAPVSLALTIEQLRDLDARIRPSGGARVPRVIEVRRDGREIGRVYFDGVIGKTELIDYATAIDADGRVRQVEILTYRESHGYEVRNPRWRQQFVGKGVTTPPALGDGIANISGATLSCRHLTDGVRRLLMLHAAEAAART